MADMGSAQELVELVASMDGIEPDHMSEEDAAAFKLVTLQRFGFATRFLPPLLAEIAKTGADSYTGAIAPTPDWQRDYLGEYTLKQTENLERFLDAPEKVQMAAALFTPLRIKIQLFAEAHHPGYQHKPHILVVLECLDDPVVGFLETAVELLRPELQDIAAQAVEVEVVSFEGAGVRLINPASVAEAVHQCAVAIREEAARNNDDFLEGMAIQLKFDASSTPEAIEEAMRLMLTVLHTVWVELCDSSI